MSVKRERYKLFCDSMTRKTYKYRLYCTKAQSSTLSHWFELCRYVYNKTLEFRKAAWESSQKKISLYDTHNLLPLWKKESPDLTEVYSQVLQNVQLRVDKAFKSFLRRRMSGDNSGYPRFRSKTRYTSICFPQYPHGAVLSGTLLKISGIGFIRVRLHRIIDGRIKTTVISKTSIGKWFVSFSVEASERTLPPSDITLGLDAGLENILITSQGESVPNPRFLRKGEHDLKRAQRLLSAAKKGSAERVKRRKTVALIHERIRNQRLNFAHRVSRRLVDRCGVIVFEKLNIQGMVKNHCLAKSISDAAWSLIRTLTVYKAEEAGRIVVQVNPAYTSQDCSRCGHRKKKTLDIRIHRCEVCGLELHRDHNAALNILRLGLQSRAFGSERPTALAAG